VLVVMLLALELFGFSLLGSVAKRASEQALGPPGAGGAIGRQLQPVMAPPAFPAGRFN
jgi:hypothetical protein